MAVVGQHLSFIKWGPICSERPLYRKRLRKSAWFNQKVETGGEKKKKGLLWWELSVALKAHTVPCTCDAVNLSAIFAGILSSLFANKTEKERSRGNDLSCVRLAFPIIFHKKKVYVFTWKKFVRQQRSIKLMYLCFACSLSQIHHTQILIAEDMPYEAEGVYIILCQRRKYSS